jgi:hypothetical protein
MSSNLKKRALGLSMFGVLFLAIAILATSGCYLEVEEEGYYTDEPYLLNLQVDWTIEGSDVAILCPTYGVHRWIVELRGPEDRTTELSCANHWSTESDFSALPEGSYTVTVRALDAFGHELGALSKTAGLYDFGYTHTMVFDFSPADL